MYKKRKEKTPFTSIREGRPPFERKKVAMFTKSSQMHFKKHFLFFHLLAKILTIFMHKIEKLYKEFTNAF